MPTFLTTEKMNPALAARVERSVTGEASPDPTMRSRKLRRVTAIARVVLVVGLTWALWSGFGAWKTAKIETETARARLVDRARAEAASLRDSDRLTADHVQAWLTRLTGPWEEDRVDDALRAEGLTSLLASHPVIYVRAPIEALAQASAIPGAAASSVKDSLLFCLADPPSARTEAALLEKVRVSYGSGSAIESQTASTRRLGELLAGMPFLKPPFVESVRVAQDREAIAKLQKDFDKAPIALAKQAARASHLLAVIDEPGTGNGPTELDGERAHGVRMFLVDLDADKVLLRFRKVVDPAWISVGRRPHYARGIDSCAFAFDVLEAAKK